MNNAHLMFREPASAERRSSTFALVVAIVVIFGVVGADQYHVEQLEKARAEAADLRTKLNLIGCQAPDVLAYAAAPSKQSRSQQ